MTRPLLSLLLLLTCLSAFAADSSCSNPKEALNTPLWSSMNAPRLPVEAVFSNKSGWVGINHVFMTKEKVHDRARALIPFMVPTTVQIYPFAKALARIHNRTPVIYIHATDAAANFPTFKPSDVHLLHMTVSGNTRVIPITSGITVFGYKATPPRKVEMAITVAQLSRFMLRLVPRHPLPSGEYLITIGPARGDGFEFGIDCN